MLVLAATDVPNLAKLFFAKSKDTKGHKKEGGRKRKRKNDKKKGRERLKRREKKNYFENTDR